MKTPATLICFILLLVPIHSFTQCIADAGTDTAICSESPGFNYYLGGQPTALAGTPPYEYSWSCTVHEGGSVSHASDFLDDTTAANPAYSLFGNRSVNFYLTVTDSQGSTCRDTVNISSSFWIYTLDYKLKFIHEGDSVQLYKSLYGGIPPISYEWTPAADLSDPTDVYTWAMPAVSTIYILNATDSAGCAASDNFEVVVYPTGIIEDAATSSEIRFIPHPISDVSRIVLPTNFDAPAILSVFDLRGQLVWQALIENGSYIDRSILASGIYNYQIETQDHKDVFGILSVE